jgi:hypothetical protein
MVPNPDNPATWPLRIPLIAHDVGRTNDRSTAVVGGNRPAMLGPRQLGIQRLVELPQGLYGSELANELAKIDRQYNSDCLIVADLSNDATYGETLFDTFGRRVIGVQIGRDGDGTTFEHRRVKNSAIMVYHVGRTFLFELLLSELRSNQVRFVDDLMSKRAYEQLAALEPEQKENRIIYKCPPGQHDDLAISCVMLAWAARHPHLEVWTRPIEDKHRPRTSRRDKFGWAAFT